LPGGLLKNIISHGIGKIAEYLQEEDVTVLAHAFTSRFLEDIGEAGIVDELRVIISSNRRITAYFTFSSQMSPSVQQFRVYGPKNSLIADYRHQTLIRIPRNYTSYLNQFIPPLFEGKQHIANGLNNIRRFLRRDFHSESGIHTLISSFYRSLREDSPLPVPYRDILLTSRIMEEIFRQIQSAAPGKPKEPNELPFSRIEVIRRGE
jgi:predicted dehydrogenase